MHGYSYIPMSVYSMIIIISYRITSMPSHVHMAGYIATKVKHVIPCMVYMVTLMSIYSSEVCNEFVLVSLENHQHAAIWSHDHIRYTVQSKK